MAYTALYRKWRPTVFEDVIGQVHITKTIKNQISSQRAAHAYLFCGTRGTGKTSTAKIFSRAVNCINNNDGNPCNECEVCLGILNGSILDVIEIDAASNNGVDNIREIRDEVKYAPSKGKFKVYIIDEVHMLSTGAFNALLKTLEEPPSHVIFILATTEPHKIPATILSRCQRFDFRRISTDNISERLMRITRDDNIDIDNRAIRLVASFSDGSMRDALSILDQCIAFSTGGVSYGDIISILGVVDNSFLFEMAGSIAISNAGLLMENVERLVMEGRDINHFFDELITHFRNLLMCKVMKNPEDVLDTLPENVEKLKIQAQDFTEEKLVNCVKVLLEAQANAKWLSNPRIILETSILKLCQGRLNTSLEGLLERIAEIENKLEGGFITPNKGVNVSENIEYSLRGNAKLKADGTNIDIDNNTNIDIDNNTNIDIDNNTNIDIGNNTNSDTNSNIDSKIENSSKSEYSEAATDGISEIEKNRLKSLWPEVIDAAKKNGKLSLFGFLAGTEVTVKDKMIIILFENSCSTNKMMIEKAENMEFIRDAVKGIYGADLIIKACLKKELGALKGEPTENLEDKKAEKGIDHIINLKQKWGDTIQIIDN